VSIALSPERWTKNASSPRSHECANPVCTATNILAHYRDDFDCFSARQQPASGAWRQLRQSLELFGSLGAGWRTGVDDAREHGPDMGSGRRLTTLGRDAPSLLRQGVSGGAWRRMSALVISVETAVISCAGTNGFAIMTLSGTPFDDQSLLDPPDV